MSILADPVRAHAIFGGTQNVSCIRRSLGCARRHCRPFAATVMMNTRLPTAVADTRWCGRASALMSTSLHGKQAHIMMRWLGRHAALDEGC